MALKKSSYFKNQSSVKSHLQITKDKLHEAEISAFSGDFQ